METQRLRANSLARHLMLSEAVWQNGVKGIKKLPHFMLACIMRQVFISCKRSLRRFAKRLSSSSVRNCARSLRVFPCDEDK